MNLQGIRSKRQMDQAEFAAFLDAQVRYLSLITDQTSFTADLICLMHRDWLGRLYQWAGHYRTVEMSKGKFHWPPAYLVHQNMAALERETLARVTPCTAKPLVRVAGEMARVQAELLLVHPFREGNGRIARWVTDLMAMQAGLPAVEYDLSGNGSTARRRTYLDAVLAGYAKDYDPLTGFLADGLTRALERNPRAPSNMLESRALRNNIARRTRGSNK